jgi:hypothetical protein
MKTKKNITKNMNSVNDTYGASKLKIQFTTACPIQSPITNKVININKLCRDFSFKQQTEHINVH